MEIRGSIAHEAFATARLVISDAGRSLATFTVNSATSITASSPSGATTGTISVTTSGGTGTSATSFTVALPQHG